MVELARPNFLVSDARGAIKELYCKVCGDVIGDCRDVAFRRLPNYAELKMQFMDGSAHVTNLCIPCIQRVAEDPMLLKKIHDCDIDSMAEGNPLLLKEKDRIGPRVVAVDTKRSGIL